MNFLNPTMTVQNTDTDDWLVRVQHQISEHEHLDVTLRIERSDASLPEIEAQVMQKLVRLAEALTPATKG